MAAPLEFVEPRTIKRACGGWLAISAAGAPLQIGVTADTEELAKEAFSEAFLKWLEALNTKSEIQADRLCQ